MIVVSAPHAEYVFEVDKYGNTKQGCKLRLISITSEHRNIG